MPHLEKKKESIERKSRVPFSYAKYVKNISFRYLFIECQRRVSQERT